MTEWVRIIATPNRGSFCFLMWCSFCSVSLLNPCRQCCCLRRCCCLWRKILASIWCILGFVVTANLAIALYTPPVGGTLFIASKLAGAGIGEVSKHLVSSPPVCSCSSMAYMPRDSLKSFNGWS